MTITDAELAAMNAEHLSEETLLAWKELAERYLAANAMMFVPAGSQLRLMAEIEQLRRSRDWWNEEALKSLHKIEELRAALRDIRTIIEHVDNRCMAVDGPVTPTLNEMTQEELSRIYALCLMRDLDDKARAALGEQTQ